VKIEPNFFGKYGFYWWIGVVEDRLGDPLKLGRVRVRILGAHTENKQLIPTPELHWAYVYTSSINPAMSGLGRSPTGILEGTWVFGFFKDSDHAQDPVVLGTLGGIPQEAAKPCIGFNDPSTPIHDLPNAPRKIFYRHYPNDGTGAQLKNEHTGKTYPRDVHPWGCVVGEADTNRLARAEKVEDTIMGVRLRQRDVGRPGPEFGGIPIAFVHPKPTRKWVEPKPGSHTSDGESTYPYVHVFESESGHIIEIDDTPNKERIHIWHRSGTYLEIGSGQEEDPGLHGNLTLKCVGKRLKSRWNRRTATSRTR
jgi:hypothetical protein